MSRRAAGWPPRRVLPRDVTVERLPGLGATWYDGGPTYWLRRGGVSLMWAGVTTAVTLLTAGVLDAIRHRSQTAYHVALGIEVAGSLAIVGFVAVRTARRWNQPAGPWRAGRPGRAGPARPAGPAGAALGVAARSGAAAGQVVLAVGSVAFVGLYLALFLTSLLPETLVERQARLRLAELLRARGLDAPWS